MLTILFISAIAFCIRICLDGITIGCYYANRPFLATLAWLLSLPFMIIALPIAIPFGLLLAGIQALRLHRLNRQAFADYQEFANSHYRAMHAAQAFRNRRLKRLTHQR